jgi:hypothetical protein
MSFRPTEPRRFGPAWRACSLAYAYLGVTLVFTAFVAWGYAAAPGSFAWRWVVEAASQRPLPTPYFAMLVLSSGLAAVMRAHMRGVVVHPDGIETLEIVALGWPKIRRIDWAMIDRFRFDLRGHIALELWDGQSAFLPLVGSPDELVRELQYIAEARAIPYSGAPEFDDRGGAYRGRLLKNT